MELTERQSLIFKGKICPYCDKETDYIDSSIVYNGVSYGMIYYCKDCDAYCGVHKGSDRSLGRLANSELRQAKKMAHYYFDQIWKNKMMSRTKSYKWLSEQIGTEKEYTHIGMFNVDQCLKTVEVSKKFLKSGGTLTLDFGEDAFDVLNNI